VRLTPLAAFVVSVAAHASPLAGNGDADAPDENRPRSVSFVDAPTYAQALAAWHSAEDVNAWIGARFEYDTARALRLSETQRQANGRLPIHPPAEFFASPKGGCVDLSRCGVETPATSYP